MAVRLLTYRNYLTSIEAFVETRIFQHIYAVDDQGGEIDIVEGGSLSCAYVVSGVLTLVGWLDRPHATVATTLIKLEEAGWRKSDMPVPGAIVVWPADSDGHRHIGFYVQDGVYVSNDTEAKVPQRHGRTMRDGREPVVYYTNDRLFS